MRQVLLYASQPCLEHTTEELQEASEIMSRHRGCALVAWQQRVKGWASGAAVVEAPPRLQRQNIVR